MASDEHCASCGNPTKLHKLTRIPNGRPSVKQPMYCPSCWEAWLKESFEGTDDSLYEYLRLQTK